MQMAQSYEPTKFTSFFFIFLNENRYLAPEKEKYFLSNKNSKKGNSLRSRWDVPETEERIEKFVDSDEKEPFQNRDFFIKI